MTDNGLLSEITDGIATGLANPVVTGIGGIISGALIGSVVTASVLGASKGSSSSGGKRTHKSRIKHTKRGWKQDRSRRSKQKWEVAYQRRKKKGQKSKSKKGIHYTKFGQPYRILANGRARFIKK